MRYCENCHVHVRSEHEFCPLCQGVLIGEGRDSVFPYVPTIYQKYHLFFKILIGISILCSVICVLVNVLFPVSVKWSIFVILGFFCLLILLYISINKRQDVPKTVVWQVVVLSFLAFLWDYLTGNHGWAIDYAIPIICTIGCIDMAILCKVLRFYVDENLIYFMGITLLGLVPLIFLFTGIVSERIPSLICIFFNITVFIIIVILKWDSVLPELKRRFHF